MEPLRDPLEFVTINSYIRIWHTFIAFCFFFSHVLIANKTESACRNFQNLNCWSYPWKFDLLKTWPQCTERSYACTETMFTGTCEHSSIWCNSMLEFTLPSFVVHGGNLGVVWAMAPFHSQYGLYIWQQWLAMGIQKRAGL